jgi:hypothetical protein
LLSANCSWLCSPPARLIRSRSPRGRLGGVGFQSFRSGALSGSLLVPYFFLNRHAHSMTQHGGQRRGGSCGCPEHGEVTVLVKGRKASTLLPWQCVDSHVRVAKSPACFPLPQMKNAFANAAPCFLEPWGTAVSSTGNSLTKLTGEPLKELSWLKQEDFSRPERDLPSGVIVTRHWSDRLRSACRPRGLPGYSHSPNFPQYPENSSVRMSSWAAPAAASIWRIADTIAGGPAV